jgi:predicted acylesterase/phospholipase RssA
MQLVSILHFVVAVTMPAMGKSLGRIVGGALILAGCTHTNVQLNRQEVPLESRIHNSTRATLSAPSVPEAPNNDGYFVGLALSGGGSRSANFSAGCMFQLEKLGILQRVDYISSVSGGSLTAAYYCLSAKDWNPGEVQRRLTHPFASDVILTALMPWNTILLIMTPWNRSDILADSFDRVLYSHDGRTATFADLRADRPRLLINATDLQSGSKFIFCNETFDDLNSDLSKYPVSCAVAASAAVPVLMHQVTLHDYSTVFRRYRHLIDGGITDNLGVTTLVEAYTAQVDRAKQTHQPDPYPHGLILIVVDAHTSVDAEIDNKPDIGILDSIEAAAGLSTTVLLNRISSATLAEIIVKYAPNDTTAQKLREQIAELEKDGVLGTRDRDGKPVKVIHLALFRVGALTDLPFVSFGRSVNSIATYFNIDPNEAYHLYKAADLLVNEDFQQPLQQIAKDLNQTESK